MATELTYYIQEGLLVGYAGGGFIHIFAGSGGGAGSKVRRTSWTANNPYATGVKTAGKKDSPRHRHGGPLPLGKYTINPSAIHKGLGRSCFLEPDSRNYMGNRRNFYIHGRGRHGSDGCIVPFEKWGFLLDQIDKDNGGTLHVVETMDMGVRFA
jgi:hypothetical protein